MVIVDTQVTQAAEYLVIAATAAIQAIAATVAIQVIAD